MLGAIYVAVKWAAAVLPVLRGLSGVLLSQSNRSRLRPHSMNATHSTLPVLRQGIHGWFERTPGRLMLDAEIEYLSRRLPSMFGYELLQVGQLGARDMLSASLILNRTVIDIDQGASGAGLPRLHARADALPVASDSVDVVLLPHVLEFENRPHEALREAQRVLVPEGNLLITGFNPWSMMGLWRKVLGQRGDVPPWCGTFLGLNRVKDWLALLGLDVTQVDSFFFRPPFRSRQVMERLGNLETICAKAGGMFGGLYIISARKRVTTLTRIKPRWTTRRRLVSVGLANPSVRAGAANRDACRTHLTLVRPGDMPGSTSS